MDFTLSKPETSFARLSPPISHVKVMFAFRGWRREREREREREKTKYISENNLEGGRRLKGRTACRCGRSRSASPAGSCFFETWRHSPGIFELFRVPDGRRRRRGKSRSPFFLSSSGEIRRRMRTSVCGYIIIFVFPYFLSGTLKEETEMGFFFFSFGENERKRDENQKRALKSFLSPAVRRSVGNNLRNEIGCSRGSDRLRSKRS